MLRSLPIICLLLGLCPLPHASAHYLWVTIDDQGGGTARIVFEEAPSAGDGHYMDHFAGTSNLLPKSKPKSSRSNSRRTSSYEYPAQSIKG